MANNVASDCYALVLLGLLMFGVMLGVLGRSVSIENETNYLFYVR